MYAPSPQDIIFSNRTRTPTLVELSNQVNTLARILAANDFRMLSIEGSVLANSNSISNKLPKILTGGSVTRVLNTPFQPNTEAASLVFYTVELTVTYSLLNSQSVTVDILCDETPVPVNSQGQAYLEGVQGLGLSVTQTLKNRQQLVAYVPKGAYVELVSSGTGSATIVSQLELQFYG